MNKPILAAAALMFITLIAHVFGGGPEIIDIVTASTLPADVRALSSVVWHGITLMLALSVPALVYVAKHPYPPLELFLSLWQLGMAALFIGYGWTKLQSLWITPQWTVFLLMPLLMYIGHKRRN